MEWSFLTISEDFRSNFCRFFPYNAPIPHRGRLETPPGWMKVFMSRIFISNPPNTVSPLKRKAARLPMLAGSFLLPFLLCTGCLWKNSAERIGEKSEVYRMLRSIGCGERAAARLDSMGLAKQEILEVDAMKRSGMSDDAMPEIILLDRKRHARFEGGETVARLRGAGVGSPRIVDLYRLNALPEWREDVVAMRGAGISDSAIVRLAELRFTEGKTGLDGRGMARIKSTGFSEVGIIALLERNADAKTAEKVIRLRGQGKSEDEILRSAF